MAKKSNSYSKNLTNLGLQVNYFALPFFIKKLVFIIWYILKSVAYCTNLFDKKPSKEIIHFNEPKSKKNKTDTGQLYAVILHTCDKYEFLRKGFLHFFAKSWSKNGAPKYFLSEDKETHFPGWTSILTGPGAWNQRLIRGLKMVSQEYIIYIQEDFWFLHEVDTAIIESLVELCKQYDLSMLKLHDNLDKRYLLETTDKVICGNPIKRVNKNSEYIISHAVSIRKKEFLIDVLHGTVDESPRDNELKGSFRLQFARDKQLQIYQYDMFSREQKNDTNCFSAYREVCSRGRYNGNVKEFINELLTQQGIAGWNTIV